MPSVSKILFNLLWCLILLVKGSQAFSIYRASSPPCATRRVQNPLYSTSDSDGKKSFASISSDGKVTGAPRPTGSLGKPSKKKKADNNNQQQQKPMSKKDRQRTANGTIQSESSNNNNADPAEQGVQVVRGTRGTKTVTIVRGMNATSSEEKKNILKLLKSKLGVGGTLVDGVLEVQGTHTDKVVEILKGMGYLKARKVGN